METFDLTVKPKIDLQDMFLSLYFLRVRTIIMSPCGQLCHQTIFSSSIYTFLKRKNKQKNANLSVWVIKHLNNETTVLCCKWKVHSFSLSCLNWGNFGASCKPDKENDNIQKLKRQCNAVLYLILTKDFAGSIHLLKLSKNHANLSKK